MSRTFSESSRNTKTDRRVEIEGLITDLIMDPNFRHSKENPSKGQYSSLLLNWSSLTFLCNVWTLFSITLWPSIRSYPKGVFFLIECAVEVWLFIDILARIIIKLKLPQVIQQLKLLHAKPEDSNLLLGFILLVSTPQFIIYICIVEDDNMLDEKIGAIFFTLIIKACRVFEIFRFLRNFERLLFSKSINYILTLKFVENLVWLILLIHLTACGWMFVDFYIDIGGSKISVYVLSR